MKTSTAFSLIGIILSITFLIFQASEKEDLLEPKDPKESKQLYEVSPQKNICEVKENRVANFIAMLNFRGAKIRSLEDFITIASDHDSRKEFSDDYNIDSSRLLTHLELADLMQLGLSEIDAQILHFSQRNYRNLFSGETINRKTLAQADPEKIWMDISGWAAGSQNPIVQYYNIDIPIIREWINEAAKTNNSPTLYADSNSF